MTSSHNDRGAALQLRSLCKHYGDGPAMVRALDGVDLDVTPGQLFGLIGHNGAGKSTLFKLLLGLIRPTSGSLRVLGEPVDGPHFRELRRQLGYLPENLVLYDNLSGLETLQFFARLKGAPLSQCEALLEQVGLAAASRRAVREYSKGMRQRLGFAQAQLGEPRLLLLDEPTTGLDPAAIRDFYQQLEVLRARGVTLVISSHILAELQGRVDALAMLSGGRLKAQGTMQSLRERSVMPLRLLLSGTPAQLDALPQQLLGLMDRLQLHRQGPMEACLRCPREMKMPVLQRLAALELADLNIEEPSLEDVYFELREAA